MFDKLHDMQNAAFMQNYYYLHGSTRGGGEVPDLPSEKNPNLINQAEASSH